MPDRRQTGVMLPENPGEEELARDWTLSEADHGEVLRYRGDDSRRFGIQLCVLRQYGTFLDRYAMAVRHPIGWPRRSRRSDAP